MQSRASNEAGIMALQTLAHVWMGMSETYLQIPEAAKQKCELGSHMAKKKCEYGCQLFMEPLEAFGMGDTLRQSQMNARCSMNLTIHYTYGDLLAFLRTASQPAGIHEMVANCFERGPGVGEQIIRVCRGCEIPALPWRSLPPAVAGPRCPRGQEPGKESDERLEPIESIKREIKKQENYWRRRGGLPAVCGSEGTATATGLGQLSWRTGALRLDECRRGQSMHLPTREQEDVESMWCGKQYICHYNMLWAAMEGCVACVKAYQEAGGSTPHGAAMDVWHGTRNNVWFNAWRATYVNQSERTVVGQERVRTYLRCLHGAHKKINETRECVLWVERDAAEKKSRELLKQAGIWQPWQ